jgi:uncharacterized protein YydD (DUF2326 family)
MRLIELSANQDSFQTVSFNRSGISLIVGKKANPDDHDRKHSTNGVGKSLLLYLIDFCLGAKENPELEEKLPEWEFSLKFELEGEEKTVTRKTIEQDTVSLNGIPLTLENYNKLLLSQVFLIDEKVKYLTFRALIGLFVRQGKGAYVSFEKVNQQENSKTYLLRMAYLLGLDIELVERKRELKEELDKLSSLQKSFSKEGFLREYMTGEKDVRLKLKALKSEIADLRGKVENFKVAENYEDIRQQAQATKRQWKKATDRLHRLVNVLSNIEQSLETQPDLDGNAVARTYESLGRELPDLVVKRLKEVTEFHAELIRTRVQRLTAEKHRIQREQKAVEAQIKELDEAKDNYFQFLGSHGELVEYQALVNSLNVAERQAEKLTEFDELDKQRKERTQKCKLEMLEENIKASEALEASADYIDEVLDIFHDLAQRIWPGKESGLLIRNNEGQNLIRFDIDARIEADASDGVSETKIFCFDMTVMSLQKNHAMRFLAHDNRLFPNIDPRQRAEVFRIAAESGIKFDFQYIATINETDLEAMRSEMTDDHEFETLFAQNTVLELTDESAAGKLLGISLDLSYLKTRPKEEE